MEARDREDLEIHQKAIQGGYRNRRGRGAGLNGIEGFLDDDADEEELQRRAALGLHMSSSAWKKRKLLDGTQDGMDALAAHDEAKAFVHSYVATHKIEHESDKYDFLLPQPGDADAEAQDSDEDDDQDEARDGRVDEREDADDDEGDDEQKAELEDVDEDAFGPVAKNRGALDDDENDDEGQRRHRDGRSGSDGSDSEEEDAGERLASALRSRVRGDGSGSGSAEVEGGADAAAPASRRPHLGMQYGRAKARGTVAAPAREEAECMDVDVQPVASSGGGRRRRGSIWFALAHGAGCSKGRPPLRAGQLWPARVLSMSLDTLEEAEPEWGQRSESREGAQGYGWRRFAGVVISNVGGQERAGAGARLPTLPGRAAEAPQPMLSSKQEIMRRGRRLCGLVGVATHRLVPAVDEQSVVAGRPGSARCLSELQGGSLRACSWAKAALDFGLNSAQIGVTRAAKRASEGRRGRLAGSMGGKQGAAGKCKKCGGKSSLLSSHHHDCPCPLGFASSARFSIGIDWH
ncbi:hypothetical protein L1887_60342 [Cichorium endivia]|nr:hypothetical protein L1887_60342 [Cichorium endivia]